MLGSDGELTLLSVGDSGCINITVVNDDVRENNETVVITAVPQNSQDVALNAAFTLTILDDGDGQIINFL